jgi:hypothetical protein
MLFELLAYFVPLQNTIIRNMRQSVNTALDGLATPRRVNQS